MNTILRILFLIGFLYFMLRAGVGMLQAHAIASHWKPIESVLVDRQMKALRLAPRRSSGGSYESIYLKPLFVVEEDYRAQLRGVSTPVVAYASFSYFSGMAAWQKSRRDKELPIGASTILRFEPREFGDVSVYSNGWLAFKGLVLGHLVGAIICFLFFWIVGPGKFEVESDSLGKSRLIMMENSDSLGENRNLIAISEGAFKVMPWIGVLLLILLGVAVHSLWVHHRLYALETELLNVNEPPTTQR